MSIEAITSATVREALRALRFSHSLSDSPLLGLDQVTELLAAEGVADTRQGRAWALGRLLERTAGAALATMRGEDEASGRRSTGVEELAWLRLDLGSGSDARLDLALLQARYLAPSHPSVRWLARVLGLAERSVHYRVARATEALVRILRDHEAAAARRLEGAHGARPHERIVVVDSAQARTALELMDELLAVLRQQQGAARVTAEQLAAVANYPAGEWVAYRLGRVAAWSEPRYRLDERFVRLSLLVDLGEEATSGRWQAKEQRFSDLREALDAVPEPAVVLLGPPGSGKSTLLRRLELDLAVAALTSAAGAEGGPLTFLVSLNQYRAPAPGAALPEPRVWLAERWATRYPQMPPLDVLLAGGGMVLLLDGLNEMPHRDLADYRERVLAWKQFLHEHVAEVPGNRLVVACRSLDYSAPLSTPRLRVPQVQLEPLADEQVRDFLGRYSPANAEALWLKLAGTPLLEAVRWPFFLRLLVEQAAETDEVAGALPALFTGFVRRALVREVERDNPLFAPGTLLDARDHQRLMTGRAWPAAWDLPERGPLFVALADLAHGMQSCAAAEEMSQVRVDYQTALGHLGVADGDDVIAAGCALGVLEEDRVADEVLFGHQLLQEYFAARRLARRPEPALVAAAWRAADISPTLPEQLATLPPADSLPPLPHTGWEETTILAAVMAEDKESFVRALLPHSLTVAGRAAATPAVRGQLSVGLLDELRWALVERSRDKAADLRVRIAAGLVLGDLGDPRFERRSGLWGEYLMPPLIDIPDGVYTIGDDDPITAHIRGPSVTAHVPAHPLEIPAFRIGQFTVTNAEWACFMAAGGYEDDRWWDTEDGRRWRRGEMANEAGKANSRHWRKRYVAEEGLLERMETEGRFSNAAAVERWKRWLTLDDAAFAAAIDRHWRPQRQVEPLCWRDGRFNALSQPVVGVTWYEARAYCTWLSAQTGLAFDLPTEVQWEATVRGGEASPYPWGDDFEPTRANIVETRIRRTTPVGVFPEGDSASGVADGVGNVSAMTCSLWGFMEEVDSDDPKFGYPYIADDGREDRDAPPSAARVVRGGSWNYGLRDAHAAYRYWNRPAARVDNLGFRLVVSTPVPFEQG